MTLDLSCYWEGGPEYCARVTKNGMEKNTDKQNARALSTNFSHYSSIPILLHVWSRVHITMSVDRRCYRVAAHHSRILPLLSVLVPEFEFPVEGRFFGYHSAMSARI